MPGRYWEADRTWDDGAWTPGHPSSGSATTLSMTDEEKEQAAERERTKTVGFTLPHDDDEGAQWS